MSREIIVIEEEVIAPFELRVTGLLNAGWKMDSSKSGKYMFPDGNHINYFRAIMVSPEEPKEQPAIEDISSNTKAGYFALGCIAGALALAIGIYLLSNY